MMQQGKHDAKWKRVDLTAPETKLDLKKECAAGGTDCRLPGSVMEAEHWQAGQELYRRRKEGERGDRGRLSWGCKEGAGEGKARQRVQAQHATRRIHGT